MIYMEMRDKRKSKFIILAVVISGTFFMFSRRFIETAFPGLQNAAFPGPQPLYLLPNRSYVPPMPYHVDEFTLYITEGVHTPPPLPDQRVVFVPKPKHEQNITNFRKDDIQTFLRNFDEFYKTYPNYRKMKLTKLDNDVTSKLNPDMQDKLKEWKKIAGKSPETWRRLKDTVYQLNVLKTKEDPIQPWKLKCESCFANEYASLLRPDKACADEAQLDLVLVITSIPRSVRSRDTIRQSWGSWTRNNTSNIRLIFLFGTGWSDKENAILAAESSAYGDILQQNYRDSYYNLAQKVISGLKWLLRSPCSRAGYIMRSAEDTFINLPEVLGLLTKYGHNDMFQDYQIGTCFVYFKPHRYPDYKGYLSTDDYSDDVFPPYALGTSYLLSMNLTRKIVQISKDMTYIPIEDSYLGLVLREIGSGCLDIRPFQPADNSVGNAKKIEMFKLAL